MLVPRAAHRNPLIQIDPKVFREAQSIPRRLARWRIPKVFTRDSAGRERGEVAAFFREIGGVFGKKKCATGP
jgi:hypothetical protein